MAFGINPQTGRPGPTPFAPRAGDKKQARQRINVEVRQGRRPHPNAVPCVDCGHVWTKGERRHEYDHHRGYAPEYHYDVESVCTACHARRDGKAAKNKCANGHQYTEANTKITRRGTRVCKECRRGYDKKRVRPPGYWAAVNQRRRSHGQ